MIENLNQIIRKDARRRFKRNLIILAVCIPLSILTIWVMDTASPGTLIVINALFWPLIIPSVIMNIIRIINPKAKRAIEKFCATTENPQVTFAQLESTWKYGLAPNTLNEESMIRFSKEYIIVIVNSRIRIIPLKNVVWVYSIKKRVKGNYGETDELFSSFEDGKLYKHKKNRLYVHFAKDNSYFRKKYLIEKVNNIDAIGFIIDCISINCPNIATAYNKITKALWRNKDIDGLRAYRH